MDVLLISTYDLGHQPFGLASAAAHLAAEGARVRCLDLAVEELDEEAARRADLIALHVPMHTATRLAARAVARLREIAPRARLCFFGLYAPMNEAYLRSIGAEFVLGGEAEPALASVVRRLARDRASAQVEPAVTLARPRHRVPDRSGLPALDRYAHLHLGGETRVAGYTEATRGCKHDCRHCPVVPVYGGRFFAVPQEVVLEDVRRQVAAGARHITFGDPDFLNGPRHAARIARDVHEEFPELTWDATVKVEHLIRHADLLPLLGASGCLMVTSAVESIDDRVLAILRKGHAPADFARAVALCRAAGIHLLPTFVSFTPWTTEEGFAALLAEIARLGVVDAVAPVQYAIRLLVPPGSLLLELPEVRALCGPLCPERLAHPWAHPDPRVDALWRDVDRLVRDAVARDRSRRETFAAVRDRALAGARHPPSPPPPQAAPPAGPVPRLTEPWFC